MHDDNEKETTQIIIISKTGKLTETSIVTNTITSVKELTEILSKKCDNKKSTGYSCYHTWRYRNRKNRFGLGDSLSDTKNIYIDLWAKTDGRAGQENKYELPPPIDEIIFFGNIALVARIDKETACNLTLKRWNLVYEKLFGGFDDLAATALADENEIDELDLIPASQKTKTGYLKDGFVVDDDETSTSSGSQVTNKNVKNKVKRSKNINDKIIDTDSDSESEFVTETETESITPLSNCEVDSNEDEVSNIRISNKKNSKPKIVKNKRIIADDDDDDDDELVEDQYETT
jgi:hypothetical protein